MGAAGLGAPNFCWQAHYVDCIVDADRRDPSPTRRKQLQATIRGIRLRFGPALTRTGSFEDRAWMALALDRAERQIAFPNVQSALTGYPPPPPHQPSRMVLALREGIRHGIDPIAEVLPLYPGDHYFGVASNGPAAIMFARTGHLGLASRLVNWIFDNLMTDEGLIADGLRTTMCEPETNTAIYPHNQGVTMAACVAIARRLRIQAGLSPDATDDRGMEFITRVHHLLHNCALTIADDRGVILPGQSQARLSTGVLARYLALVAEHLPEDQKLSRASKRLASKLVLSSAQAAWDAACSDSQGHPLFGAQWNEKTTPDQCATDFAAQLSGWMLMEAAARLESLSLS